MLPVADYLLSIVSEFQIFGISGITRILKGVFLLRIVMKIFHCFKHKCSVNNKNFNYIS
jgi:hypothetical protein